MDSDGTQDPVPPNPFSDSLGGSTGSTGSAQSADSASGGGPDTEVAKPVSVNREAVQELVKAMAAEKTDEEQAAPESGPSIDDEPTAEIPPQTTKVRASKPALLPPILRMRKQSGGAPRRPRRPSATARKPSSGSAGIAVALVLLVIFILLAIQFVASFVESVAGIFG